LNDMREWIDERVERYGSTKSDDWNHIWRKNGGFFLEKWSLVRSLLMGLGQNEFECNWIIFN
jgi:hypothetical protein